MQCNFEPLVRQIGEWRGQEIYDQLAKLIIYRAFIEGELEAPRHLARTVHERYFRPQREEFAPRTMWSLSNASNFGVPRGSQTTSENKRVWLRRLRS